MSLSSDGPVTQILVGLRIVGLVGLGHAIEAAAESGHEDRDLIVDHLLASLASRNHLPTPPGEDYRTALWREYVRHRGGNIRDLYSELAVVVLGAPGSDRDLFVETLRAVLADHELRPAVAYGPPDEKGPHPRLLIAGETVVRGLKTRRALKRAIRGRISHW